MFLLGVFFAVLGLANADQCSDDMANCKSTSWDPFKDDQLPDMRCDAAKNWQACLLTIDSCDDIVTTEADVEVATNCYVTADSPCAEARQKCKNKFEKDSNIVDIRACSRAAAWMTCVANPDVVHLCGAALPDDVRDNWVLKCYS